MFDLVLTLPLTFLKVINMVILLFLFSFPFYTSEFEQAQTMVITQDHITVLTIYLSFILLKKSVLTFKLFYFDDDF